MIDPRNFVLTWKDNPSGDDVVPVERRNLIDRLKEENEGKEKCPHSRQLEEGFFYCGAKAVLSDHLEFTEKPSIDSAQYQAQVNHLELQIWCMAPKERYSECIYFQEAKDKIIDG